MQESELATRSERLKRAIRRRHDQQKEELQQIILKAASELFLEQGYDKFSMRGLAERIGYSPTTIYLYFRDKDALLFSVVDEGFTQFTQQLQEAAARSDEPWERLMELGEAYVSFGLNNPVYYQLMFMQRTDFLMDTRPGAEQPRYTSFEVLKESVQRAIDAQVLLPGDAEAYSDALWSMMHGFVALAINVPFFDVERQHKAREVGREMIFRGLRKL